MLQLTRHLGNDHLGDNLGARGRERPAEVAVAGVVVDTRPCARTNARHHVGHHRAQARPGHNALRLDAGEVAPGPGDERRDAVGADVAVLVIELGRARNPEPSCAEPAGDDLGRIVE